MSSKNILIKFVLIILSSMIFFLISNQAYSQSNYLESKLESNLHDQKANSFDNSLIKLGYKKIPIIEVNHLLYIMGTVNSHPVYFLLDTGSVGMSILSSGLQTLNLKPFDSQQKVANATGGVSTVKKVLLPNIDIANLSIGNAEADLMTQPFKNDLPTIVLGNNFFRKYHAILNIDNKNLYLNEHTISKKEKHLFQVLLNKEGYQNIPLTSLSSGHLTLPIQINSSKPAYFLFDTGTSETTISIPYINYLKIRPNTNYKTQAATDGTITFAELNIKNITYNPLQLFFSKPIILHNIKVAAANISSLTGFLGVVGIMGLSDMKSLQAVIDISGNTVYFK